MSVVKKVLVTGAFGNLGQMVVAELHRQDYSVIAMDLDNAHNRRVARDMALTETVLWGDIRDIDFFTALENVIAVIHLAAILPPGTENMPSLARQVNVEATRRLIAAIERSASKPLLVYPSSVTVFGLPDASSTERLMRADDPVAPSDNYTRHKIEVEQTLADSNLAWSVMRVGVSVDARTLGTDLATLRQLFGVSPDNPLEYVHPMDVATAMVNVISRPQAWRKILLIGGGTSCRVTQHKFLSAALDATGIDLPREMLGTAAYYTRWMDTAETQQLLNFQHHSFEDYCFEMRHRMRLIRPLLTLLSPLILWLMRRMLTSGMKT